MSLQIVPVESRRDLGRFIAVPWHVRDGDHPTTVRLRASGELRSWTLPLRVMVKEALDPTHDPFWKNADRALFFAERDGRPVGRIAAIENRRHNDVHGDRVGFFGFFDCEDDPEAATALFDHAARWLAERGLTRIRGPMSPSMNHECGLLVGGFHERARILTPWNPPWYEDLVRGAGFDTAQDLIAYPFRLAEGFDAPDRLRRLARRVRERGSIEFRPVDLKHFDDEIRAIHPIYNSAWAGNWGFVPMTSEEFEFTARSLKPLIDTGMSLVACVDGVPVGFCLVIKDLGPIFDGTRSGRLGPLTLLRLLFTVRRMRHTRVILLGIDPESHHGSVLSVLIEHAIRSARDRGDHSGDASWILEQNTAMRSPLESLGIEEYRRWRIFEKPIDPTSEMDAK